MPIFQLAGFLPAAIGYVLRGAAGPRVRQSYFLEMVMKTYLEQLQLRWKLALMLCVPIMALTWFAQGELRRAIPETRHAEPMINLIELSGMASALVHTLQKERGATAGFVGSGGQKFKDALGGLRSETDVNRKALEVLVEDFPTDDYGQKFSSGLNTVMSELQQLADHRSNVTALSIDKAVATGYYTGLNSQFLKLVEQIPVISTNGDVSMRAAAYSSFLWAKELAGRERAVMTGVLSRGEFSQEEIMKVSGLITQQATLLNTFQALSTPQAIAVYQQASTDSNFAEIERMRAVAFSSIGRKVGLTPVLMDLGYGGLIHNFKNYILRADEKYVDRFNDKHTQIRNKLTAYLKLPGLTAAQQDDVRAIIETTDRYKAGIETASEMFADRDLSETVDRALKIDDGPALAAIERLQGNIGVAADDWFQTITGKINRLKDVEDELGMRLMELVAGIGAQASFTLVFVSTVAAVALGMAVLLAVVFTRIILRQLGSDPLRLLEVVEGVAAGDLEMDLSTAQPATGIFGAMQTMQGNLRERVESDRHAMEESTRLKSALDRVGTNVLMVDDQHNIIYANDTFLEESGGMQGTIGKVVPGFRVDTLVGSSIDMFYSDSAQQRNVRDGLTASHEAEIKLDRLTFKVVSNPVFSVDQQRLGTVIEWTDRTQELAAEKDVQAVVSNVLDGDLTRRISVKDKGGFFKSLSEGVNGIVIKLADAMTEIHQSSSAVQSGATEISQGNTNLSQRTEEQAASLEETASSMTEITRNVRNNAEAAANADKLSSSARDTAEQGGEVVGQAIQAMDEINASSKKIADIIGAIDEIAFQTNLLALNASVEAARAGEQGRGFAVVASEVRNLAGRSANAAKEIKDLIEHSVASVEAGSQLVNASGETLSEIVAGVREVSSIVGDISEASQRQSNGIDEISTAIAQMDEMTQQNAALVEEIAAASENMRQQAEGLNDVVAGYSVDPTERKDKRDTNNQGSPTGVERRGERRPWSDTQRAASGDEPMAAAAVAGGGGGDWKEF